jgi:chromosome segregation ATPase
MKDFFLDLLFHQTHFLLFLIVLHLEHEAYAKDIIELRWHIEDRTHQLEQLEKQKTKLKEANAKIQEDIDYMREHSTFLEAKQKQEKETLKEQYNKKHEVSEQMCVLQIVT